MELSGIELDLLVHGFIEVLQEDNIHKSHPRVRVTEKGVSHLSERRQAVIKAQSGHHLLGARLASHLHSKGLWTWENIEFRNPQEDYAKRTWGTVRPDVYACKPSLNAKNIEPVIYEIKISRADFLADIAKPEKRLAYKDLAQSVYYCCPAEMLLADEIPDGFGLLWEHADGSFSTAKKAKRTKGFVISTSTALTLMIKRQMPLGSDALPSSLKSPP